PYIDLNNIVYLVFILLSTSSLFFFFFLMLPPPPRSTLFPYTTLFRSLFDHRTVTSYASSTLRNNIGQASPIRCNEERRLCTRQRDRKSTRLNSSHDQISYAVFCLKKKKKKKENKKNQKLKKTQIIHRT